MTSSKCLMSSLKRRPTLFVFVARIGDMVDFFPLRCQAGRRTRLVSKRGKSLLSDRFTFLPEIDLCIHLLNGGCWDQGVRRTNTLPRLSRETSFFSNMQDLPSNLRNGIFGEFEPYITKAISDLATTDTITNRKRNTKVSHNPANKHKYKFYHTNRKNKKNK